MFRPIAFAASLLWLMPAAAHDYPTIDRVEYVLECISNNGGEQHYLYRCSCVIDALAKDLTYEEFVQGSTVARYQGMGGERAGVFRDPDNMKDIAKRYRGLVSAAKKQCDVAR